MGKKVSIGRFGSPFGVRGWIKVISYTDPRDQILTYRPWQIDVQGEWQLAQVVDAQSHVKNIVVKLEGCDDRNAAQLYTHQEIAIEREQLPVLKNGEYYWVDLIGLEVITTKGEKFGFVDHLFATGNNDVFVVKGDRERLIPYIDEVIKEINLQTKRIVVDWDASF